jgi:hypothetical protein
MRLTTAPGTSASALPPTSRDRAPGTHGCIISRARRDPRLCGASYGADQSMRSPSFIMDCVLPFGNIAVIYRGL